MRSSFASVWFAAIILGLLPVFGSPVHARKLDFNRDVRPILADKCFACHGQDPKHVEGDLRLDFPESAKKLDGEGRAAIIPGKPELSKLVRRINSTNVDEQMPPAKAHKKLLVAEKELLARWIAEGADYKPHWAFLVPVRPYVPRIEGRSSKRGEFDGVQVANPIDAFVVTQLQSEGLTMSPEADRTTLIRRVSLDLTGLPPSIAEVDAFLADTSDNAYEHVVDRLLASPHYGERMAMWWLDGARYADSNGFEADDERFMWRWRDWVLEAYNRNMPFDQFTIEQLAGDLLPNATTAQRIATGFNRNHRMNAEDGIINEEWRIENVIDRVETTSAVWMALTVGCARCHDHKFDPLTQREFYQLFSFFNNVPETGRATPPSNTPPFIKAPRPEDERTLAEFVTKRAAVEMALAEKETQLPTLQAAWERDCVPQFLDQAKSWRVLTPKAHATGLTNFTPQPDGSYVVSGETPMKDVYTLETHLTVATSISAIQFDVLLHVANAGQSFGRAGDGNVALSEFEAEVTDSARPDAAPHRIKFTKAKADYSQPHWVIASAIDGHPSSGWALDGNNPDKRADRHALFFLEQPLSLPHGGTLTVRVRQEAKDNHNIGRFRLAICSAPGINEPNIHLIPPLVLDAFAIAPEKRTDAQKQALTGFFRTGAGSGPLAEARAAVDDVCKAQADFRNSVPTVMVMEDTPRPRDCFVLIRGQYDKPGEKVAAALPTALPPLPPGQPMNRLGLAHWLVDPSNPLTARVQVNRYWEMLFGVGIVKSTENFGVQSDYPSHPELLDWLATEYIRLKWNTKAILKTIVMSGTYRQSSKSTAEQLNRDLENRRLARGPRFRVCAELVRDNALAISGLLIGKLGGPSVRPYQPEGVWDETQVHGNLLNYKHDTGEGLYRRSMYTIWKRTSAPPDMTTFDMQNRELCIVKRGRTNTPLQALTLLNDITYLEAARMLAQRMLLEGGETPDQRIIFAFRRATARLPSEYERQTLAANLKKRLQQFRTAPEAAKKLIAFGESKADSRIEPSDLAAYTMTASVILNLDETITKE